MPITIKEVLERESIDEATILRHGFTDYMRDFEIIAGARNEPPHTDIHKYQFIGCSEAACSTKLVRTFHEPQSTFGQLLSDQFVLSGPDYPEKDDPDGFIWGVRFAEVLSGWVYVEDGKRTRFWSDAIRRRMHQVYVDTNAYRLELVFADIRYAFIGHETSIHLQKDYPLPVGEATSDGCVT